MQSPARSTTTRFDRLLSRLDAALLPVPSAEHPSGATVFRRYARIAGLTAAIAIIGFVPSLPMRGVPTELWAPFLLAVLATALIVMGGLLLPRPDTWTSVFAATVSALTMSALHAFVADYYFLSPLVYTAVLVVEAVIQGVRPALAMVVAGAVLIPLLVHPGGSPSPDDFLIAFIFLLAPAIALGVYRRLQARGAAALEASETRYRELVERMPGVVYECEPGLDGAWTYVSPKIEQVLGFPPEAFTSNPDFWWSRIHDEDREEVSRQEARLEAEAGVERNVTEYRMLDAHGGIRWISDEATLLRGSPAAKPIWSGILIDVTAEKELEVRLRQAQRMEAVGQLAGGIAHDFNNLLTVIRGYGALIQADLAGQGRDTLEADELVRAAERAGSLIGQLMAFGSRQVRQPRVLDPSAVIADLTPMLRRLLGDHVTLAATTPAAPVYVCIDRSQLEQVVVNLAVNARDAMPDGGQLTIAVDQPMLPTGHDAEAPVRITVRDTGSGMDEAVRARIFEPFFTTKAPGNGTGLGLPTVMSIVSQAGGHITCESAPERGTAFVIDLPSVEPPGSVTSSGGDAPAAAAPGGQGRILLVEDQEPVRKVTSRMLRTLGYSVAEASSGLEALMALTREPELALLVTDVTMPGMLGTELARRATEQRPGLRVLLITGYAGEGRSAVDRGPFPVLAKPFDVGDLARAVQAAIDGAAPVAARG